MPRPKGSKNKKTLVISLDERINQAAAEVETLQEQLKAKKAELKQLQNEKAAADRQRILDTLIASGKTADEITAIAASMAGKSTDSIIAALDSISAE